jgi:hypothetical protein
MKSNAGLRAPGPALGKRVPLWDANPGYRFVTAAQTLVVPAERLSLTSMGNQLGSVLSLGWAGRG